ncbi:MAG TPA: thioredoxin domain-containing protein [Mycobacteriales bacterium]|nr:thioredoxin domain-containing protein [Mycobacteriales bacterium]
MSTPWDDYEDVPSRLTDPVDPTRDHIIGPPQPRVTLVEYGDYQCPFCGQAHQVVAELLQTVGDSVQYVFRHFPLTTVHPHAEGAAEAAEAAGAQGRFWPMHDTLFTNQRALAGPHLLTYAQALGLDEPRFVRDLRERVHAPRVRSDFLGGVRSGVNGTPTFFIDGVRHDGSFDYDVLLAAVQQAMSVGAAEPSGGRHMQSRWSS